MYKKSKSVSVIVLLLAVTFPAFTESVESSGKGDNVELNNPNSDLEKLSPKELAAKGREPQNEGLKLKKQADSLRKEGKLVEADKIAKQAQANFIEVARILGFLAKRFPSNKLAPLAGISAGQNLMRAEQFQKAFKILMSIADNKAYDAKNIRSQALFWSGMCKERMFVADKEEKKEMLRDAYNIYDRIRFDFPTTKWAKFARGRLADKQFQDVD